MLNLKPSVLSVDAFVIGCAKKKVNGPIGVYQFAVKPAELRILFESSIAEL